MQKSNAALVNVKGQLERVTFKNEENGYTVAKILICGSKSLVTAVGNIPSSMPGEILNMSGEWSHHPKFGEQFKVVSCSTAVPASVVGIEKYLGGGLIKGIGPIMAKRIVSKFGEKTLDIIEKSLHKLLEIDGIGENRIEIIGQAWSEQKEIRTVMMFLQSHDVSSVYATKIYKKYGNKSINIVKENPYRLANDIFGIGFSTADKIAQKLGFDQNSPLRAQAGILYVLEELTNDGHVFYPIDELLDKSEKMLTLNMDILVESIKLLEIEKKIVIENLKTEDQAIQAVFLYRYYFAETQIATMLKEIKNSPKRIKNIEEKEAISLVEKQLTISLAQKQIDAIKAAIINKVLIITGGPGVGKTTITKSILQIFSNVTNNILLAAPTGRAAKRMSQATGKEAKTIHRLLEFNAGKGGFQKDAEYHLNCDLIIIDEASMIDTLLMYHLMMAIPKFATVIFVGDINQLPSVGAGNILKDIIESNALTVVKLNEIFRQAQQSKIIVNSHKIINGQMPQIDNADGTDFYFMQEEEPESALSKIVLMVKERITKKFGYDPINDIQVLTPMNRGIIGTIGLNNALQQALNPNGLEINRGEKKYRVGDKVMQIKNNYDKEVFNGDIGFISNIDTEEHSISVNIDDKQIIYEYSELDELVLAYAVSIHKSQGSEYPVVVIPVMMTHYVMLARNLIYTGITRGRKLVIIVGSKKAMFMATKNNKTMHRFTSLKERLS